MKDTGMRFFGCPVYVDEAWIHPPTFVQMVGRCVRPKRPHISLRKIRRERKRIKLSLAVKRADEFRRDYYMKGLTTPQRAWFRL